MHTSTDVQLSFDLDAAPSGLVYLPDFIDAAEERALVAALETIEWQAVVMHGQAARRTVAHFGLTYGYSSWSLDAAPPLPPWIAPLLPRIAAAMHEPPNAIAELLASRYPPGARIGWHRDMIKPVPRLRYSLSFRTLQQTGAPAATRTRSRRTARTRSH